MLDTVPQLPWGHILQFSAVDDHPTIGLLFCRSKNRLVAKYALRGMDQSITVAAWKIHLTESLPEELHGISRCVSTFIV